MNSTVILLGKYLIGLMGIGLVVLIHEVGHLVAARACKIDVEVFSFGLGPKLWGKNHKGTDYRISAFPLGGYCRLKGSDDLRRALLQQDKTFKHIEQGSLFSVHPFKRIVTYLAGPLLNVVFAILLYTLLASIPTSVLSTEPVIALVDEYPSLFNSATSPAREGGLLTGDRVTHLNGKPVRDWEELEERLLSSVGVQMFTVEREEDVLTIPVRGERSESGLRYGLTVLREPIVGGVRPATPEHNAGLLQGDRIVEANGMAVESDLDLLVALAKTTGTTELLVRRGQSVQMLSFRPDLDEGGKGEWNFSLASQTRQVESSPFSIRSGWNTSLRMVQETLASLVMLIQGKSKNVRQEFTGAARAALMIGDITSLGLESSTGSGLRALWYLLGVVSISLAVANLLPLPAFDGGQMLTALFEWITGKRIQPKIYWILQLVGIALVIGIFVFLGYADMLHFLAIRR